MTTTGGLISWAVICATYLRFRKACQIQNFDVVPASASPLQPALAWYGLIWTIFLSNIIHSIKLIFHEAIFQGYLMFARSNAYWRISADSWGYTVSPYMLIAAFLLLVLAWLARTRGMLGDWTWQTPQLTEVNLVKGIAAEHGPRPVPRNLWRRAQQIVLESI